MARYNMTQPEVERIVRTHLLLSSQTGGEPPGSGPKIMGITCRKVIALAVAALATSVLAACDENGQFNLAQGLNLRGQAEDASPTARGAGRTVEEDVEAPEVFSATEQGLWDGRPSLGGIWVAHPDVGEPERVIIRNASNGRSVVGALFRRERDVPGPMLQISSDAAAALGMVAGEPQELDVTALRRREVPLDEPETEDTDILAPPEEVTRSTLDPVANASDPIGVANAASAAAESFVTN